MVVLVYLTWVAFSQNQRYWSNNFNEEASLLCGAVVGGGAGNSAIYYNPATISEAKSSSFSFNASLASLVSYKSVNALGDGIDLKYLTLQIQPRFISYLIQPKNNQRLSLEIAMLSRENSALEYNHTEKNILNILKDIEGNEKYHASYNYLNKFSNYWAGIGGSYAISNNLSIGTSVFAAIKSLRYINSMKILAFPLQDSVWN